MRAACQGDYSCGSSRLRLLMEKILHHFGVAAVCMAAQDRRSCEDASPSRPPVFNVASPAGGAGFWSFATHSRETLCGPMLRQGGRGGVALSEAHGPRCDGKVVQDFFHQQYTTWRCAASPLRRGLASYATRLHEASRGPAQVASRPLAKRLHEASRSLTKVGCGLCTGQSHEAC